MLVCIKCRHQWTGHCHHRIVLMNPYQQPQPKQTLSWSLGKQWLSQGIQLFQKMQKHWYATLLLVIITVMLISILSTQVAMMALMLAMPLMTAWYYLLCRQVQSNPQQGQMSSQLWSRCGSLLLKRFNVLLLLGVLAVILNYAMHALQLMLLESLQLPPLTQETAAEVSLSEALTRLTVNVMTGLPVALLMAFSPALVVFNEDTPVQAMIRSVKTVIFAWRPILSLTLWLMLLAMAAAFIVSLVMGLLAGVFGMGVVNVVMLLFMGVMMGVVFSANYVTYDALYPVKHDNNNDSNDPDSEQQESIYKEI